MFLERFDCSRPNLGDGGPSDAPMFAAVLDDGSAVDWNGNRYVNVGGNDVSGAPVWVPEARAQTPQFFFNPAVQQPEYSNPVIPRGFVEAQLAPPPIMAVQSPSSLQPAPTLSPVAPSINSQAPSATGPVQPAATVSVLGPATSGGATNGGRAFAPAYADSRSVFIEDAGEQAAPGSGWIERAEDAAGPAAAAAGGFPWGLLVAAALAFASR